MPGVQRRGGFRGGAPRGGGNFRGNSFGRGGGNFRGGAGRGF